MNQKFSTMSLQEGISIASLEDFERVDGRFPSHINGTSIPVTDCKEWIVRATPHKIEIFDHEDVNIFHWAAYVLLRNNKVHGAIAIGGLRLSDTQVFSTVELHSHTTSAISYDDDWNPVTGFLFRFNEDDAWIRIMKPRKVRVVTIRSKKTCSIE